MDSFAAGQRVRCRGWVAVDLNLDSVGGGRRTVGFMYIVQYSVALLLVRQAHALV